MVVFLIVSQPPLLATKKRDPLSAWPAERALKAAAKTSEASFEGEAPRALLVEGATLAHGKNERSEL